MKQSVCEDRLLLLCFRACAQAQYAGMRYAGVLRAAAIELFRRGARPVQDNPYFFLQHFSPVAYFLNERDQYQAYKQGSQLCSVRWNGDQRVMAAFFAELFKKITITKKSLIYDRRKKISSFACL